MKAQNWITFAAVIMLFASCSKENLPLTGSVSGTVTSGTGIGTPAAGVKMYLGNLNIKPDTVHLANNRRIMADSTVTDGAGKYHFSNIPEGKWAVAPAPDPSMKMDLKSSGDSTSFLISGIKRDFNINFQLSPPKNAKDYFSIHFEWAGSWKGKISCQRTWWEWFFVYHSYPGASSVDVRWNNSDCTFEFSYGYNYLILGLTNHFTFSFFTYDDVIKNDVWLFDAWILNPTTGCPEYSTYTVDIDKKTCIWKENR